MRTPDYVEWERAGQHYKQVSAPWKRELLLDYAYRYQLKTFVETGTCEGDTVAFMIPYMDKIWSVELDKDRWTSATRRFEYDTAVTILHGNSGLILPEILKQTKKALFWLDAHNDNYEGPLFEELVAIHRSKVKGIVLVDDMDYIPKDAFPVRPGWKMEHGIMRIELTDEQSQA